MSNSQADLFARLAAYGTTLNQRLQPARAGNWWTVATAVSMHGADSLAKSAAAAAQAQIGSATGQNLTNLMADRGVYRKAAVAATAPVQFSVAVANPSTAITLGAGTLIQTTPQPGPGPIQFATLAAATIPAGATSSNVVTAQAVAPASIGAIGNVATGTLTQLASGPGNVAVTNTAAAGSTGYILGADVESDTALRYRGLLAQAPPGTPAALGAAALAAAGIFTAVCIDGNAGTPDGSGNVHIYAGDANGSLAAYLSAVQAAVTAVLPAGLTPSYAAPTVTTQAVAASLFVNPSYTYATVASQVSTALTNWVGALKIGQALRVYDLVAAVMTGGPNGTPIPGVYSLIVTTPTANVVPAATTLLRLSGSVTLTQVTS